jgi:hypothetical protein
MINEEAGGDLSKVGQTFMLRNGSAAGAVSGICNLVSL